MRRLYILLILLSFSVVVQATTYEVTRLDNGTAGFGMETSCTLGNWLIHFDIGGPTWNNVPGKITQGMFAHAIHQANLGLVDTIVFSSGLAGTMDMVTPSQNLKLCADNVVIDGAGADVLISCQTIGLLVIGQGNEIKNLNWSTNSSNDGAVSIQANGNTIENCVFESGNIWVGHVNLPTLQVYNCTIKNVEIKDGDLQIVGDDNVVEDCIVSDNLVLGNLSIGAEGNAERNVVTNCTVGPNSGNTSQYLVIGDNNNSTNVDLTGQGVIIRGNENVFAGSDVSITKYAQEAPFLLSAFAGIEISTGANNNTVEDNIVTTTLTANIDGVNMPINGVSVIAGSNNDTIRGNQIIGFFNGIKMEDSDNGWIENNKVSSSVNHGIFVVTNADGNHVLDNNIANNGFSGVSIHSSKNNQVYRNTSFSNTFNGLALEVGASSNVFSENILYNQPNGIIVYESNNNRMLGNIIGLDTLGNAAANEVGINIQSISANNEVGASGQGNVISSNTSHGILIDGAASVGNTIHYNNTSCNGGKGIALTNGGNANYGAGTLTINWGAENVVELSGSAPAIGDVIDIYIVDSLCHSTCRANVGGVTPSQNAQGMTWVASVVAVSDGEGGAEWIYDITSAAPLRWENAIVTATNPGSGNTSEFNTCVFETLCDAPLVSAITSPSLEYCEGGSLTLTATVDEGKWYSWSKDGVIITSGLDITTLLVNAAGEYKVKIADPADTITCMLESTAVTIVEHANPSTPVITGDDLVCFGENGVNYSTTTFDSYAWTVFATGASITAGQDSDEITVNNGTAVAGDYVVGVIVTDANGCVSPEGTFDYTIKALPEITGITGPAEACENETGVGAYSVTTVPASITGATYAWSSVADISIATATTATTTIDVTTSGIKALSVGISDDGDGCATATDFSMNITVNELPTVGAITGPDSVCENELGVTYATISSVTDATFEWAVTGATIDAASTSNSIDLSFTNTDATLEVTATAKGCEGPASAVKAVTINALPTTSAIVADDSICLDQGGVTFTVDAGDVGDSYAWTVSDGTTFTGGTSNEITVDFSGSTAGIVTVSVLETSSSSCVALVPSTIDVELFDVESPAIIGNSAALCNEAGVTYNVAPIVGFTYTWTVPNGSTIVSGQDSESIVVDLGDQNGDVTVIAINEAGCESEPTTLSVTLSGCGLKANFSVVDSICFGNTVTITDLSSGDNIDSLVWNFGVNATPSMLTQFTKGQSVDVDFSTVGDQEITLTVYEGIASDTYKDTVTVNGLPTTASKAILTVSDTVCPNSQDVAIGLEGGYDPTISYEWTINPVGGVSLTTNPDSSDILVDFGTESPVSFTVSETNVSGCTSSSPALEMNLFEAPDPIEIVGDTNACINSLQTFNVTGGSGGTITWSLDPDSVSKQGIVDNGTSIDVVFDSVVALQEVRVIAEEVSLDGCSSAGSIAEFLVTMRPLPTTPIITGEDTICAYGDQEGYTASSTNLGEGGYFIWFNAGGGSVTTTNSDSSLITIDYPASVGGNQIVVGAISKFECRSEETGGFPITFERIKDLDIDTKGYACSEVIDTLFIVTPEENVSYEWSLSDDAIINQGNTTSEIEVKNPAGSTYIATVVAERLDMPGCKSEPYSEEFELNVRLQSVDLSLVKDNFGKATGLCELTDERFDSESIIRSDVNVSGVTYEWYYRFNPDSDGLFEQQLVSSTSDTLPILIKDRVGEHQIKLIVRYDVCNDVDSTDAIYIVEEAKENIDYKMDSITICVEDVDTAKVRNNGVRDPEVRYTWYLDEYKTITCLGYDSSYLNFTNPDTLIKYGGDHQKIEQYDTTVTVLVDGEDVRNDSLIKSGMIYHPEPDSTSITLEGGDIVSYDDYIFQAKFGDQIIVVAEPQYCIVYDKDDENAGLNLLRDTITVEVISRPGADIDLYDLGKDDYSGNVTLFDLEEDAVEKVEVDPYEIEKLEDDFALLEVTDRSSADYVFAKGKTDVTYDWKWYITTEEKFDDGFVSTSDQPNLVKPTLTTRSEEITYQVITDNGYCTDSATFVINIGFLPWPPNAFTPNGDTHYDLWEIRNVDKYPGTEVKIYNRWGVELLTIENYDLEENWWDGTKDGNDLPTGTYFYWIDFKDGLDPVTGAVSIVK